MKCPECGEKLENGARYCNKCAAIFPKPLYEEEPEVKVVEAKEVIVEKTEEKRTKKSSMPKIWYYFLSAFIPFAGLIFYFIYKKEDPKLANTCLTIFIVVFILVRLFK